MFVTEKQRNSKMCVICGLDNPFGVSATYYNMQDAIVMSVFRFRAAHRSYPRRVHAGLNSAMRDGVGPCPTATGRG